MNYSQPLTSQERKVLQPMLSQKPTNRVVNPKEKIAEKSTRTLPIRSQT